MHFIIWEKQKHKIIYIFSYHIIFQSSTGKSNNDDDFSDSEDDDQESTGPLVVIDGAEDDVTDGDGIQKLKLEPKKSALKKGGLKRFPSQGQFVIWYFFHLFCI